MSSTTSTTTITSSTTSTTIMSISQQLIDLYADILFNHKILDEEERDKLKDMSRGDEEMRGLADIIIIEKLKLIEDGKKRFNSAHTEEINSQE